LATVLKFWHVLIPPKIRTKKKQALKGLVFLTS
jgi:hypothetical protein